MFKISKPESFMLPSPSREDVREGSLPDGHASNRVHFQVGKQNAAECIPLILEPESGFYSSPVLVFDFQSLYPSVMIAYNLCYSTCLGRLKEFMGTNRLGTSSLAIAPGTLSLLKDCITRKLTEYDNSIFNADLYTSLTKWTDVPQTTSPPESFSKNVD